MPRFKVQFARDVTERDYVYRVIEADSEQAAAEQAERMASHFNGNCPDDTITYAGDCADWEVCDFETTDEPLDEEIENV